MEPLDALFVATHPDDAESTCGGTIAKLAGSGARIGILDCSRGELGTRGTPQEREVEAARASAVLGIAWRSNLGLPDGRIVTSIEARDAIAHWIRLLRPRMLFAPWWRSDLHPDHSAVGALCRQAYFVAGLKKLELDTNPHRPSRSYYYASHDMFEPQFVVGLDKPLFEKKLAALRCFASQLKPASINDKGQHFVHGQDLEERITLRARYFGAQVGAPFGEPFRSETMLSDFNPLAPAN